MTWLVIIIIFVITIGFWIIKSFFGTIGEGLALLGTKLCPYCREKINIDAKICKFCRNNVENVKVNRPLRMVLGVGLLLFAWFIINSIIKMISG